MKSQIQKHLVFKSTSNIKNKTTSSSEVVQKLKNPGLDTGKNMSDDELSTKLAIVNLHPNRGTH